MKKMFNNLTIQQKLWVNAGLAIVVVIIIAIFTFIQHSATDKAMHRLVDIDLSVLSNLHEMYAQGLQGGQATRNAMLNPKDTKALDNFKKARDDFDSAFNSVMSDSDIREHESLQKIKTIMDDVWQNQSKSVELAASGKNDEALELLVKKATPGWREAKSAILELAAIKKDGFNKTRNELKTDSSNNNRLMFSLLAVSSLVYGVFFYFIAASIIAPLRFLDKSFGQISEGYLDIAIKKTDRKDEFGKIIMGLERVLVNFRDAVGKVGAGVNDLSSLSGTLENLSGSLSTGAADTSAKAVDISGEAGAMNNEFRKLSSAIENVVFNINAIAGASEELSITISEIASNAGNASRITASAATMSADAAGSINQLGEAAKAIADITETITDISSQTNLLALNATIEASRAGEAGRGFAVVASEIKDLANQTAEASGDIKKKVEGIQQMTGNAVSGINRIHGIINEASDLVSSMAAAIEQQAGAVNEVARNIASAAEQSHKANSGVSASVDSAGRIESLIEYISRTSREVSLGSTDLKEYSSKLSGLSHQLDASMNFFRLA